MRLFTTQEINASKAKERKLDIDQGMNIAKRVDNLRESLGKEEKNLTVFRTQTVTKVQKEIDGFILQRDNLKKECTELEQKRAELMKPLDEAWMNLHKAEELHERNVDKFIEAIKQSLEDKRVTDELKIQAQKDRERAADRLKQIDQELVRQKDITRDSINMNVSIEQKLKEVAEFASIETARLQEWDRRLSLREVDLQNKRHNMNIEDRSIEMKNRYEHRPKH